MVFKWKMMVGYPFVSSTIWTVVQSDSQRSAWHWWAINLFSSRELEVWWEPEWKTAKEKYDENQSNQAVPCRLSFNWAHGTMVTWTALIDGPLLSHGWSERACFHELITLSIHDSNVTASNETREPTTSQSDLFTVKWRRNHPFMSIDATPVAMPNTTTEPHSRERNPSDRRNVSAP
jgi:hypothetical protein